MQNKNINLIRYLILKNCYQTKEGHVGSAFSILEILIPTEKQKSPLGSKIPMAPQYGPL